jgi:hypothetical protein
MTWDPHSVARRHFSASVHSRQESSLLRQEVAGREVEVSSRSHRTESRHARLGILLGSMVLPFYHCRPCQAPRP